MLGGILYNILTLNPPITERKQKRALEKAVGRIVPHPSVYNRGMKIEVEDEGSGSSGSVTRTDLVRLRHCQNERVPSALAAVAMKALMPETGDRYQTVGELQRDVEAYQMGFATSVERAGLFKHVGLFVGRHKAVTILSAVASIILAVVLAASYSLHTREKRSSVPALVSRVGVLIEKGEFSEALETLSYITTVVPEDAEYHAMKGNVLQTLLRLEDATVSYEKALDLSPDLDPAGENLVLCRKIISEDKGRRELRVSSIYEIYLAMRKQWRFDEAMVLARRLSGKEKELREKLKEAKIDMRRLRREEDGILSLQYRRAKNISRLTGIPLSGLDISGSRIKDISALKGMPLSRLNMGDNPIVDISVLENMPLYELFMQGTRVTDLAPLRDMSLKTLYLEKTPVSDLTPLQGMPLKKLNLYGTVVKDLYPLVGMKLNELYLRKTLVDDVSPLEGMPLVKLDLQETKVSDITPLRGMELRELNLSMTQVSEVYSLEGMPLTELNLTHLQGLNDISVLNGMKLNDVKLGATSVMDLSPLAGMKVATVDISQTPVVDITPLRDVQMSVLWLFGTSVTDLSPLQGKSLKMLDISSTRISDLSMLKGVNITDLKLEKTPVVDLSPLAGMKLASLNVSSTYVEDLSPLQGMPLVSLKLWHTKVENLLPLKDMRTLTSLEGVETRRSLIREMCESRAPAIEKNTKKFVEHFKDVPAMAGAVLYAGKIMKHLPLLRSLPTRLKNPPESAVAFQGHHYLVFPLEMSWNDAEDFCASRGGHLVTITSKEENDFVLKITRKAGWGSFLVGYRMVARKPQWVTDEQWKTERYQNPHSMYRKYGFMDTRYGRWTTCDDDLKFFVIEWDEEEVLAPAAGFEPATK
ncbi:MAG: hypothetical protein KAH23_03285 [Kiritimatiellae bacterium]|nr:hypothetical protein [Kiritimatiellia bacterium]